MKPFTAHRCQAGEFKVNLVLPTVAKPYAWVRDQAHLEGRSWFPFAKPCIGRGARGTFFIQVLGPQE